MSRANGYFEAFVNRHAYRPGPDDRGLIEEVTGVVRANVPGSQVRWAGSQRKGTAIAGSDLDLCVETSSPVTEARRRDLRSTLASALDRPAIVLSHAIRMPPHAGKTKVDIAFANAAFGCRPLPDAGEFHDQRSRQAAARALKLWTAAAHLRSISGWAVEALVVHLDANPGTLNPLDLFLRIIDWLGERATPQAVEGVLRPAAFPEWNPEWSKRLPGQLEAVSNQARSLRRRHPVPEEWKSADDVGRWLGR